MKTVKQIADELGIDKQKVYRYIKNNHINEVHQEVHQKNSVKYYDDVAESLIKQGLADKSISKEVHQEVHQKHINDTVCDALLKQIDTLQNELKVKNEQINTLSKLLDQEQQLHALAQSKIQMLEQKEDEEPKKKWWQIWK